METDLRCIDWAPKEDGGVCWQWGERTYFDSCREVPSQNALTSSQMTKADIKVTCTSAVHTKATQQRPNKHDQTALRRWGYPPERSTWNLATLLSRFFTKATSSLTLSMYSRRAIRRALRFSSSMRRRTCNHNTGCGKQCAVLCVAVASINKHAADPR